MSISQDVVTYERKNYVALDVAKFICALLIVAAHFASEWASFPTVVDYAFSIYVIAVPFFFCCSGFLFFVKCTAMQDKKERTRYFISYQKRIWIMYGLWTLVYIPFIIVSWIQGGVFGWERILAWLHQSLVFQTYSTIWFLPALAVGIAISYFLVEVVKDKKYIIIISLLLYVLGAFGQSYSFVFKGTFIGQVYDTYLTIFKTSRNGLFNAVPFICMGYLFVGKENSGDKKSFIVGLILSIVFLGLIVAESFILKIKFAVTGMDVIFMLLPFTYFFMKTLLSLRIREGRIYVWMRKISLLIFTCQRLFLTALPQLLPSVFSVLYANSYVGLIVVLTLTIGFSALLHYLSGKIKFLKLFM